MRILKILAVALSLFAAHAEAQTVGTYTDNSGTTRSAQGVTIVSGTAAAPGDANGLVTQPGLSSTFWTYAGATGGIVNTTTATTMKAAAGVGVRNYLCTLNVGHDTLGAASELAVRNGAAGTVIFRMKLQTPASEGASEITFAPCLRGTANTLMEVVTLTATVSGGTFVNASGYTGN